MGRAGSEAAARAALFVAHGLEEHLVDVGEIRMNYATAGASTGDALLLIPAQTESWWGYEAAIELLKVDFQVFAVDLRGQGRTTWTPGRYTLDNMGNDLVRFIDLVIGRPTFVSGRSSGGVLAAWLAAYAKPGQIRAVCLEDPPLFSSERCPACGPAIRQSSGAVFELIHKYLGDQWSVGAWDGLRQLVSEPGQSALRAMIGDGADPPQNLKEYDPEWGRAFATGTVGTGCDHERMLRSVKAPVLLTHHFRRIDEKTGRLVGALADIQARRVRQLIEDAGQRFEYRSFPEAGHFLHQLDPATFCDVLKEWVRTLPD